MVGFNGEFMWQDLPPKSSVIALTGAPGGGARLYSVTANLILHTPEEHHAGAYLITGGGWYHRSWDLTAPSLSLGTVCLPSYAFWGVACTNGIVSSTVTLDSGSADGGGWNIGAGFTYRMKESHLKVYAETRYHVALVRGIFTPDKHHEQTKREKSRSRPLVISAGPIACVGAEGKGRL
jgi:hypothetical protein